MSAFKERERALTLGAGRPQPVRLYAVQATIERQGPEGWTGTDGLPTFYLDPVVQGITGPEHAEEIARRVIGCDGPGTTVHVHVEAI